MTYFGCEANKTVEVCVSLSLMGELEGEIEVVVFTSNGVEWISGSGSREEVDSFERNDADSALPGLDYQSIFTVIVFTVPGTTCATIELIEDLTLEIEEMFTVFLESGDPLVAIPLQSANVIIKDSDRELYDTIVAMLMLKCQSCLAAL